MDLVYLPLVQAALLLPGVWLCRKREPLEALGFGAALGIVFLGALAFARFLAVLPPSPARESGVVALAVAVLGAVLLFLTSRRGPTKLSGSLRLSPALGLAIGAIALTTVGYEATVPHFGAAGFYFDWWEHFDLAHFYQAPANFGRVYPDGSIITSRTPLLNLLGSLAMSILGPRFTVFQLVTAAIGWLWALPFALIARRIIAQQAPVMLAILAVSPVVLVSDGYTWPKGLVCFFVLFAVERFMALHTALPEHRNCLAVEFGLISGATLMAHLGFIGYLLALFGIFAWQAVHTPALRRPLALAVVMAFLVALPWYAWAIQQFGLREALFGYPALHKGNPLSWIALANHAMTLATSFLPIPLAFGQNAIEQVLTLYVRTTLGLMGSLFFLRVAAAALVRSRRTRWPNTKPLLLVACVGVMFATFTISRWGAAWAWAASAFVPALLLLALIGWSRVEVNRRVAVLMLIECCLASGLIIATLWSPVSAAEPNTRLATDLRVTFLGNEVWPVGVILLLGGVTLSWLSVWKVLRRGRKPEDAHAGTATNLAVA